MVAEGHFTDHVSQDSYWQLYTVSHFLQDLRQPGCFSPPAYQTLSNVLYIAEVTGPPNSDTHFAKHDDGIFSFSSAMPPDVPESDTYLFGSIGEFTYSFDLPIDLDLRYISSSGGTPTTKLAFWYPGRVFNGPFWGPFTNMSMPNVRFVDQGAGNGLLEIEWVTRVETLDGSLFYSSAPTVEVAMAGQTYRYEGEFVSAYGHYDYPFSDLSGAFHNYKTEFQSRRVSVPVAANIYPISIRWVNQWGEKTRWVVLRTVPIIVLNTTTPDDVFFAHDASETYAYGAAIQTFRWQTTNHQDPGDPTDDINVDVTQNAADEGFALFQYDYQELAESIDSNGAVGIVVAATNDAGCQSTLARNSTVKPDPPFIGLLLEPASGDRYTAVQEGNDIRVRRFDRDGVGGVEMPLIPGLAAPSLFQHASSDAPSAGDDEFGEDNARLYLFARKRSTNVWALYFSDNSGESFTFMSDSPFNSNYKKARPCHLDCGGLAVCAIKKQTGLTTEIYFSMSYDGINWEPVVYVGERGESIHKTFFIIQEHATNSSRLIITNGVDKHFVSDNYGEDWDPLESLS
jgi:hypothetical protein